MLYIGIVPLGILHVGNFIQREFSLHLLHMNYMICRWIPCKGNHLNPAQSINITRMWFYVKPRLLRGSLIVVLKDTVCKDCFKTPYFYVRFLSNVMTVSGYIKYNYLTFLPFFWCVDFYLDEINPCNIKEYKGYVV